MKKKMIKFVIAITVIIIGAVLLIGPRILAGRNIVMAEKSEEAVFSVRTHEVRQQTLSSYLDVNGDIVCTRQADVYPDANGILVSVQVSLGSYVSRGQVIAEVDPSLPGLEYLNSPVNAPISGIISRTPISTGTTVRTNTSITTISTNENLEINVNIPEREIAGLAVGLTAEVILQAYPGESFLATVNRVSPIVDSVSRTKLINLRFNEQDRRISAGMFARVRLNTRTYPDVITVPSEAVISSYNVNTVYVVQEGSEGQPVAEKREVSTGVSLQGLTEIKSGLEAGELVIVQGQQLLSGGEALQIIGAPK